RHDARSLLSGPRMLRRSPGHSWNPTTGSFLRSGAHPCHHLLADRVEAAPTKHPELVPAMAATHGFNVGEPTAPPTLQARSDVPRAGWPRSAANRRNGIPDDSVAGHLGRSSHRRTAGRAGFGKLCRDPAVWLGGVRRPSAAAGRPTPPAPDGPTSGAARAGEYDPGLHHRGNAA